MQANANYIEWLNYAEDDLKSASDLSLLENPVYRNVCYLCHQSSEKALKAFIIFNFKKHKFTHDLDQLCDDCIDIDQSFIELQPYCFILNSFSVGTRYPNNLALTEVEMNLSVSHAKFILTFVKDKINPI